MYQSQMSTDSTTSAKGTTEKKRSRVGSVEINSLPTPEELRKNSATTTKATTASMDLLSIDAPATQPSITDDLYSIPQQTQLNPGLNGQQPPRPIPRSPSSSNDLNGLTHDGGMGADMFAPRGLNGLSNGDSYSGSGSDHSSPALMRQSSSFDELKKSINELHQHNIVKQQQQQQQYIQHQQQHMGYAQPAQPTYAQPVQPNYVQPAQPNYGQPVAYPAQPVAYPMMGQQVMYAPPPVQQQYPVAAASMQPGVPPRPTGMMSARPTPAPRVSRVSVTATNPPVMEQKPDMGWSGNILKPAPIPKPEPPKVEPGVNDPFAFLGQTTNMDFKTPVTPQNSATMTNGSGAPVLMANAPLPNGPANGSVPVVNGSANANQELLDLFG